MEAAIKLLNNKPTNRKKYIMKKNTKKSTVKQADKRKVVKNPEKDAERKAKKAALLEAKKAKAAAKREKAKAAKAKAKERAKAKKVKEQERAKKVRLLEKAKKQKARDKAKKAKLLAKERSKKAAQATKAKLEKIKANAKKAIAKERERTAKEKAKVKALSAKAKKMKTIIPTTDAKTLSPKETAAAMKSTLKTIANTIASLPADDRGSEIENFRKLGYLVNISADGVLSVSYNEVKTKKLKIGAKLFETAEVDPTPETTISPESIDDEELDKIINESKDMFGNANEEPENMEIPAGDLFATDGEVVESIDGEDIVDTGADENDENDGDEDEDDKQDQDEEDDEDEDVIHDTRDDDDKDKIDFRREWNNEFDDDGERVEY